MDNSLIFGLLASANVLLGGFLVFQFILSEIFEVEILVWLTGPGAGRGEIFFFRLGRRGRPS